MTAPRSPLTDWLDHLRVLTPPQHVTVVGAGNGSGPWVQWLKDSRAPDVSLIEGSDVTFAALQAATAGRPGWHCRQQVVAAQSGSCTFHTLSVASESGLLSADQLQAVWPNVGSRSEQTLDAVGMGEVLRVEGRTHGHWLVIDCWPAVPLLQALDAAALQALDVVVLRTWLGDNPPDALGQRSLDETVRALGFKLLQTAGGRHPAVGHSLLWRDRQADTPAGSHSDADWQRSAEELAARLQEAERAASELMAQLEGRRAECDAAVAEATALARQVADQTAATNRVPQLTQVLQEQLLPQLALQQALPKELEIRFGALASQIDSASKRHDEHLAQQLIKHQEALKEAETRLRNDINKGMANAVRQIEAYVGIQNFMASGESLTHFHGWPISPDIGLFLLERLQSRHYDLIIEFGSGTSTLLFAKALAVLTRTRGEPASWKAHPLQKRVLSFEHDMKYHDSTRMLLEANDATDQVDLVHAPLVSWQDETGSYLYYDCDAALQKAGSALGPDKARILVLVDGPPGSTCTNARYPAVPHIFNRLARHHIDVVLDDASRPEEKASIDLWRQFWKKRSVRVEEATQASEKGIYEARS